MAMVESALDTGGGPILNYTSAQFNASDVDKISFQASALTLLGQTVRIEWSDIVSEEITIGLLRKLREAFIRDYF